MSLNDNTNDVAPPPMTESDSSSTADGRGVKTRRNKRKVPGVDETLMVEIRREICASLSDFRRELSETLQIFRQDVASTFEDLLKKQNERFDSEIRAVRDSHDNLQLQFSDCKDDISQLKKHLDDMNTKNSELSEQLRTKEQEGRRNNLEISGVTQLKNENLLHILKQLCVKVGFSLTPHDIDYIHRVRRFQPQINHTTNVEEGARIPLTPNIIVRFSQRQRKKELLAAVRARRGLTTADLGLDGAATSVFVNDHLAPHNKLIYRQARQLGKQYGFKYIWLNDCKIFLRKSDTCKPIVVTSESDLCKIK